MPRCRASQSTLPATAQIQTHRLDFSSFPIIGYSLTSETVPQKDLWELATYEIKPRLNGLPGVASVLVQGGQRPEFHVVVDPPRMLRAKASVADIVSAVNRTNVIDSPGFLTRNHQLFLGLITGQVRTAEDIGAIVVKHVNNVPVRVQDVGNVAPGIEPVYTSVSANGKPALLVSVNRQPDSNTVQVADEVHQEMAAIRPTLPAGIEMRPFYDQSNIVQESIASVRDAIVIGLFLAGLIIWLFLRDWGTAVMTGLVVPVTMVITFIVMKMLGQSFNLMTLGGLAAAVGLVIDDKIVVVENIVLHRDSGEGPLQATASALKELTVPLIGSTLTPIVVFLPLITITGVTGTFFSALAIAMSVSLLTSLVLALVWTSNLSTHLIRRGQAAHEPGAIRHDAAHPLPAGFDTDPRADEMRRLMAAEEASMTEGLFGRVLQFYERSMRRALMHPIALVLFCAVLIVASYACYRALGSDLLPAIDEGGFVLDYVMPPGSSLQETDRVMRRIEAILRATPEVESTSRRTGLELGLAAVTEPNTGDIAVKLKAGRSRGVDEVIADVRAKVRSTEPGLDVEFIQVLQDMIGDLTGAPEPVVVKLFSPDAELLATWAPQVAEALAKVKIGGVTPDRRRRGRHREHDERPGGSFHGQSRSRRSRRIHAGRARHDWRGDGGRRAGARAGAHQRPAVPRARAVPAVGARVARVDEQHDARELDGIDRDAGGAHDDRRAAGTDRDPPREPSAAGRSDRAAGRRRHGNGNRRRPEDRGRPEAAAVDPRRVRRHVQRAAEIIPRSHDRAGAGHRADLPRAPVRVPIVHAACGHSLVGDPLDVRGVLRAAHHADDVQRVVVHGPDHGGRHRRQERHPAARREREVPRGRILAGGGDHSGGAAPVAADRDDCDGGRGRHAAAGAGARRRIADAAAAGDCGDRRHPDFDVAVAHHHAGHSVLLTRRP